MDLKDVLSPGEAAEFLHMSPYTLEKWRRIKAGPAYIRQCSRKGVVYLKEDLVSWLHQNRLVPAEK